MSHYILGDKEQLLKELDSDRKTQGLMQVYQDYCTRNQNNCLRCQFPSVVERYFKKSGALSAFFLTEAVKTLDSIVLKR